MHSNKKSHYIHSWQWQKMIHCVEFSHHIHDDLWVSYVTIHTILILILILIAMYGIYWMKYYNWYSNKPMHSVCHIFFSRKPIHPTFEKRNSNMLIHPSKLNGSGNVKTRGDIPPSALLGFDRIENRRKGCNINKNLVFWNLFALFSVCGIAKVVLCFYLDPWIVL